MLSDFIFSLRDVKTKNWANTHFPAFSFQNFVHTEDVEALLNGHKES